MPLDVGRITHLADKMHRAEGSNGTAIASNWILSTDGTKGVHWRPETTGGTPSLSYGSNANDVGDAGAAGASSLVTRADHVHRGVRAISANGSNSLFGNVNLKAGTGIALGVTAQDITITNISGGSSGGGGGSGAPTTAQYFTAAADASLSAEIVIPGLAVPDRVPTSPDADDDEFNTTDTSDPMTGWTTLGTPTAHNMNSTALSHYYVSKNAGSLSLTGIYKAQSSPFTVVAKVSDFIIGTDVQARVGIFVGQATPGNVSSVSRAVSGSVISQDNWSNPTTFSSSGATTGAVDMMTCPLYFKIIVTSTSNVAYYYSLNGLLWRPVLTGHNPGFTIGSAGLFIDPSSAGAAVEACFDYIRFS
jgi:hypothetical protein